MPEIVEGMEARFCKANRVWVMDRGMASAENIAWLNATRRRYVIGAYAQPGAPADRPKAAVR